jgi:histidyl-tRNA synthetase
MQKITPQLVPGTLDFDASELKKREHIISTIKNTFALHNFEPLETPAIEKLDLLKHIYGTQNEKLIFNIVNSAQNESEVANKGLRYDLTVPLARYIAMNQHKITFPFKRYQIQNVWRADRPQKSRYREFLQCDVDTLGTPSLICEAEIIDIVVKIFTSLNLKDIVIKINHRKILKGIAKFINISEANAAKFYLELDKIDKLGVEKFEKIILGIVPNKQDFFNLKKILEIDGNNLDKLEILQEQTGEIEDIKDGINEIKEIFHLLKLMDINYSNVMLDFSLARGLSYYTGAIFEVVYKNSTIGSIGGGGRYDNITKSFGFENMSGVGFSFGINRIYDILNELKLFPMLNNQQNVLVCNFDKQSQNICLKLLSTLRKENIACEIYLDDKASIKKQLTYANKKAIRSVIIIGSQEREINKFTLKDMHTGTQEMLDINQLLQKLKTI